MTLAWSNVTSAIASGLAAVTSEICASKLESPSLKSASATTSPPAA